MTTTAAWADQVWRRGLRPEPRLSVSEWADRHRILAGKASSEPGRWRTARTPYLRAIMDALSPHSPYERVVFMAGAQLGKTEAGNNWLAFIMHHAPGPVMAVQPTVEGAKRWSRQRVDPLVESPPLRGLVRDPRARDSGNTTLMKEFPGGVLVITGGNSAVGLRSMPVRYLFLDEVDGYPVDADGEGDPVDLAVQRTATFGRRKKILMTSTPTVAGLSRIEAAYLESDQRRFWVPCPECRTFQVLAWKHVVWSEADPLDAAYGCPHCGCLLPNSAKAEMLAAGEWRADTEGDGRTAGFHLSSLYSPPGWLSWGDLADEFVKGKDSPSRLQVFVNTKLGETWQERGEAPDWQRLFERTEPYRIGTVPAGGLVLTAGADIQRDRIELEVVAWGRGLETWSVDYRVLDGDTSRPEVWNALAAILDEPFDREGGGALRVERLAVDSGFATQEVYGFVRRVGRRAMAVKGSDRATVALGTASPVDVNVAGRRIPGGAKVWPLGVSILKRQLYDRLGQARNEDGGPQPGFCHFPNHGPEFFKMLTAEQLMRRTTRTGFARLEWVKTRPRNEALDCRVYATAAALALGVERWTDYRWRELEQATAEMPLAAPPKAVDAPKAPPPPAAIPTVIKSAWLGR
ncbi:phage terminase large subunit family protein [Caenispirillum bisanense]|uniref:phage terminase large subunit family protein n=1 Tax=Caenispirillum bisanense TaxID=414052 RepID=UPI0031DF59E3